MNSTPGLAPAAPMPTFTVALANGRTLTCPAYPDECTWAAVLINGQEVHRTTDAALAANSSEELTRLADALIPGRPVNRRLPQPADENPADWRECAVATVDRGCTIRFDPDPDPVDRLRICDPAGEEIAYWSISEFQEDAADCLGAAIGALAGGVVR